jgi:hypothetical protein
MSYMAQWAFTSIQEISATVSLGGNKRADRIWTQEPPQIQDDAEANDQLGLT